MKLPELEETIRFATYENVALAMKVLSVFNGLFLTVGFIVGYLLLSQFELGYYNYGLPTSSIFRFYAVLNMLYLIVIALFMVTFEFSATLRR